jgi:hypothetical protein
MSLQCSTLTSAIMVTLGDRVQTLHYELVQSMVTLGDRVQTLYYVCKQYENRIMDQRIQNDVFIK